jgi:DNA modification methylase
MQAFRQFLGTNDMLAYLSMMAPRLLELRRVLKPTGSIYLHCDPTASHYLKMLMDAVFGPKNFRNEIVWERTTGRKGGHQFGRVHDVILFYAKTDKNVWNPPTIPQTADTAKGHDIMVDADGTAYRVSDLTGPGQGPPRKFGDKLIAPRTGRHWQFDQDGIDRLMSDGRIVFSGGGKPRLRTNIKDLPGVAVRDVWTDIEPINSAAQERMPYPTQKPIALLRRIISASCPPGGLVCDPFCGCGTTVDAAQEMGFPWVGIDITHLAINAIKLRLHDRYHGKAEFKVIGEPVSLPDAVQLAKEDPYQFQFWSLGLVGARPDVQKKGADQGIDGRLFFHDESESGKTKQIIFSVKAGNIRPAYVSELRGVIDREQAAIGVLITMEEPTKAMRTEAASADFYISPFGKYPRLQILTIADLLSGKGIDYPSAAQRIDKTYKKAPKAKGATGETPSLPL